MSIDIVFFIGVVATVRGSLFSRQHRVIGNCRNAL
jgi:hypothetical protein